MTTNQVAQNSRNFFSPVLEARALYHGAPGPHPLTPASPLPGTAASLRVASLRMLPSSLCLLPHSAALLREHETSLSFLF